MRSMRFRGPIGKSQCFVPPTFRKRYPHDSGHTKKKNEESRRCHEGTIGKKALDVLTGYYRESARCREFEQITSELAPLKEVSTTLT